MPVQQSVATNNQLAIVANRFNYSFNLKGAWLRSCGAWLLLLVDGCRMLWSLFAVDK